MKKTKNYAMPYPEQDDYFNVEDFQDMMVSVDNLMKKLSDSGAQISSDAEHLYNQTKAQMDNIQKRMNTFTSLKDGSTTGDAELEDIRVAYDGKEYGNAGEAVREQASDIHKALFGAGASIWSKAKSESTKYVAETKGICILNERFTAAGVVTKISRGTFAENESTLNLDRECSAYIVEFEKNPGTVYMPSAETIKIVSTTKIIFEANGNARCWIPVEKGQYLAVDSTATAYTSESNHVPYMLYDQANKTLECRGFGSAGSIEPVDPYSLALEYKLEYDMDDTGLVKQIDANREDVASLKEDLGDVSNITHQFFGIKLNWETGAITPQTGVDVDNNTRSRTRGKIKAHKGDKIESIVNMYVIIYGKTITYEGWIRSWIAPENCTIRIMVATIDENILKQIQIEAESQEIGYKEIVKQITKSQEETPQNIQYNVYETNGNLALSNMKIFTRFPIPAYAYVESIKFHQRSTGYSHSVDIELWKEKNGVLSIAKTIPYVNTKNEEKDVSVSVNEVFDAPIRIAITRDDYTVFAMVPAVGNERGIRSTDLSKKTYNTKELTNVGYKPCISATYHLTASYGIEKIDRDLKYNIIKIGDHEYFKDIQNALDFYTDDTKDNQYLFEIMPGIYNKFDMTTLGRVRYISMIGKCKKTCIIRDDTGQYHNAPALVYTNGTLKNLTFIATHNNPPSNPENAKHKSYALHMDCGTQDVRYEDCYFESHQAPAVGIGCYQDAKYHFVNCEMHSFAPEWDGIDHQIDYANNYSYLSNYGGLFCHSNTENGKTNQRIILDNCRIYSANGTRGLWITTAGEFLESEMLVTCINTMALNGKDGVKAEINPKLTITPDSYGNNW